MLSHLEPLVLVERRGLSKNRVGHSDFSDVVKERTELKRAQPVFVESEFATQTEAEVDDSLRVAVRFGVARLQSGDERLERHAVCVFERVERAVKLGRALPD